MLRTEIVDEQNMNLYDYAAQHGLKRVGARPNLLDYFREVWQRRVFISTLAKSRISARNQQNRLGMAWLVITPLVDALVYGTVFGLLQGDKRPEHFILFLLVGIFFFRFFNDCIAQGARSVINNRALVQTLSFPRMVLPLSVVMENLINFLPALIILLLVSIPLGSVPNIKWLYLVPIFVMYVVFNAGIAFVMARIAVTFRDIGQIIPFTTRFLRYFSGVFYNPAAFLAGMPIAMLMFELNPIYNFLEMVRYALIPGYQISLILVINGVVWSFGMLVLGVLVFWSSEEQYGRII